MPQEFSRLEMEKLPDSGVYLLLIKKSSPERIKIGSLGELCFKEGYYVYVGTAQRYLKNRIERHLRKNKRKKWHIDYLLDRAFVEDVFVLERPRIFEEKIAIALSRNYEYIRNFGSTDTKAPSHLFHIRRRSEWNMVKCLAKEVK